MLIHLGHSPDPDDAFMFWGLASGEVDPRRFEFEHVLKDIQTLNTWALDGKLEVSAISLAAYPLVQEGYVLLPHGASMGSGYGPILVAREEMSPADARDDDRPIARAHRRAVRQQHVLLLHERVRGERDRGHLEPPLERPLVQRLDVAQDVLELELARVDLARGEAPEHERVVRVWAVSKADQQSRRRLTPLKREGAPKCFGEVAAEADRAVIPDHDGVAAGRGLEHGGTELGRPGDADRDRDRWPRGGARRVGMNDRAHIRTRSQDGEVHRELDARSRPLDELPARGDQADVFRSQRFVLEPGRRDRDQIAGPRARVPLGPADEPSLGHSLQRCDELLANG